MLTLLAHHKQTKQNFIYRANTLAATIGLMADTAQDRKDLWNIDYESEVSLAHISIQYSAFTLGGSNLKQAVCNNNYWLVKITL